ncbi:MAG: Cys-tRNA(Pro) deacylase [Clostridiales bacterium]|nr:Cys-tRNA(Pro) deacylase [Clostridiales bacterium]
MKKEAKTNAMRILDRNKISYKEHLYESDGFADGVTIANKLNQPTERVFKTLVAVGKSRNYYVFVVPVAEELNLKAAAAAVGEKSVEMIHVKDINSVTGYIRGGCSPIGMKKQFKTVINDSAQNFDNIIFSGGRRGAQIEMNSNELADLIGADFAHIIQN